MPAIKRKPQEKTKAISLIRDSWPWTTFLSILFLLPSKLFAAELNQVVVTGTRIEQSNFALPMAIDTISDDSIRAHQLQANLSETLTQIPGVIAHNRQNYAQDLQISIRGFGARSTFGIRGVRLYVDGIPATMPDGQGQLSHIDLASAQRIEVLRGPFSALYGNASGGVISVFSATGKPGTQTQLDLLAGSYGTQRQSVQVAGALTDGAQKSFDYVAAISNFSTDGYRDHSAMRRTNGNLKMNFAIDENSEIKIIANALDMPEAQDPLGLTRAQFESNPQQAGSNADLFNTRKSVRQQQLGADYRRSVSDIDTLNAMIYRGQRSTVQFQSTPMAAQSSPTSAGGVIDLERDYWGIDTYWTHTGVAFGKTVQITGGLAFDNLDEARQGFLNNAGNTLGIKGERRRDEMNRVYNFDQYVQLQWQWNQHWLLEAGIRNSKVRVESRDRYIVADNGDDSGSKSFNATTPTIGATWSASDTVNFYAAYGKGFETPTLNELSYKTVNGSDTGLNLALQPSRSEHYEIGAKILLDENSRIDFALFHVITHDELIVSANSNGRSTYQNIGQTQRDGMEWQYAGQWENGIGLKLAYTLLRAQYADDFIACAQCSAPLAVDAGNRIPGVPINVIFGELSWRERRTGFTTTLAVHSESKLYVNDANSDATDGYTTLDWSAGFSQQVRRWQFEEFIRLDNLTDRNHVGSVIVNESNGRYFESAPGRNGYIGIHAKFAL